MLRSLTALLLGVALVLMHHAVGAPQDGGDRPAATATIDLHSPDPHSPDPHGAEVPADAPHGDHASTLLHLCLAVLVALATAVVLVAAQVWRCRSDSADDESSGDLTVAAVPRPPPVPVRLASLQILRL